MAFSQLFSIFKPIIAMIHVPALPGTPAYRGDWSAVLDQVEREARLLVDLGVDGIMLENMHDTPYLNRQVGPEITAAMTAAALRLRSVTPSIPCGLQILAGANQSALAAALAADLQFIRAEGFVFGHLADEGWINSDAGTLLRYRRQIGAEHIDIWTDIKKKHSSHAASQDVNLAETAKAAAFFRTDGLIVTGGSTGAATSLADVRAVKEACPDLPVLIGSGITADNLMDFQPWADGFIVGSALKRGGHWANEMDADRISTLLNRRSVEK